MEWQKYTETAKQEEHMVTQLLKQQRGRVI